MKRVDVNWKEVNELGERTHKNSEEIAVILDKMIEIVDSLPECWQGADSENYITSTKNYFERLKEDKNYLERWSDTFKRSSKRYNGGVEDGLAKIRKVNEEYTLQNPILENMNEVSMYGN